MRPVKLSIKGINSYVEEQTVNFEVLSKGGVFGIFGQTGSGKSTIIDGLTLALFGPKNYSRDTVEFINTGVSSGSVKMDFTGGDGNSRDFRVERVFMRTKDKGGVTTKSARLIESDETGAEASVIEGVREVDAAIREIIGLSADDFKRSVVLPQGKFSEFLKLQGTERRGMLERLLKLEDYGIGLSKKSAALTAKLKGEIYKLEGKISTYSEDIDVKIKEIASEIESKKNELCDLACEIDKNKKEHEIMGAAIPCFESLEKYRKTKSDLEKKAGEIEEMRIRKNASERACKNRQAYENFNSTLESIEKIRSEIKNCETIIEKTESEYKSVSQEYEEVNGEHDEYYEKYVKNLQLYEKAEELLEKYGSLWADIKNMQLQSGKNEIAIKSTCEKLFAVEESQRETEYESAENGKKADEIKIASHELAQLYTLIFHEREIMRIKKDIEETDEDISVKEREHSEINEGMTGVALAIDECESKKLYFKSEIKVREDEIEKVMSDLTVNRHLEYMAQANRGDGPCILCGSTVKPDPISKDDISKKILEVSAVKGELETELKLLKTESSDNEELLSGGKTDMEVAKTRETELVGKITDLKRKRENLKKTLTESEENIKEILRNVGFQSVADFKDSTEKRQKDIEALNREREDIVEREKKLRDDSKKLSADLNKKKIESASLEESIRNKEENLEESKKELRNMSGLIGETSFDEEGISRGKRSASQKKKDIIEWLERVPEAQKTLKEEIEKLENKKKPLNKKLQSARGLLGGQESGLKTFGKILNDFVAKEFSGDMEFFKAALDDEKNIDGLKREIDGYDKDFHTNELNFREAVDIIREKYEEFKASSSADLKEKERRLDDIIKLYESKKSNLENETGRLQSDLDTHEKNRREKEKAEKELAKNSDKFERVSEINKLLGANRFVEFVAGRHMKNIANEASKRLLSITGDRYALGSDKQGNFSIIDLGSGGEMRDCKSLSGGEMFIASLALSLSVSNYFSMKGRSNIDFFILDEGFGTLDKELLEVVMNSLEGLREQGILIGIVTHVGEIKQRLTSKIEVAPALPGIRGSRIEIIS